MNAWNRREIEAAGLPFLPHDDRYSYGGEWLSVVEALMRGGRLTHRGRHFQVDDYVLRPAGTYRPRPRIYVGGESPPARALAAELADVWFINGQPLEDVKALIADAGARPRKGAPLRFRLPAFVIARETEAEAQQAYRHLLALAEKDSDSRAHVKANTDPSVVMRQTMAKFEKVGTNGGTAAGLVGSYDQVAEHIARFHAAGIETLLTQFQPFEAEMRRFAEHVMPWLRAIGTVAERPAAA